MTLSHSEFGHELVSRHGAQRTRLDLGTCELPFHEVFGDFPAQAYETKATRHCLSCGRVERDQKRAHWKIRSFIQILQLEA